MVWFLAAARILSDADLGVVATGLAFFAVFAGFGDLGTTRSVVRFTAADPRTLWPAYRRALGLRVFGGLGVGLVTAGVIALLPVPVSPVVVLLAGAMATASGATELAYASLRSIGRVRAEMALLVAERSTFLVLGLVFILRGGGPLVVLALYTATNAVSAVVSGVWVYRQRGPDPQEPGSLVDREARFTAAAFALVTVSPRIAPILTALLASSAAVGVFSVAQRPIESMTLFALSAAAPLFPIVRARLSRGDEQAAMHAAVSVAGAISVVMAPVLIWFVVSPEMVIELLFGQGRYDGADVVLRLLAFTALSWALRGVGEFVLLSEERASTFFAIATAGSVATIVLGVPLILALDSAGAAWAIVGAELLMTVALLRSARGLADRHARRAYAPAAGVAVATAVVLVVSRSSVAGSIGAVAAGTGVACLLGLRMVRRLERQS